MPYPEFMPLLPKIRVPVTKFLGLGGGGTLLNSRLKLQSEGVLFT